MLPRLPSIATCARQIREGVLSPVELVESALATIKELNPRLNALLTVSDTATREAAEIARRLGLGQAVGVLAGIPLTVKDLILTRAMPTTAGSRVLGSGLAASRDALLVQRLKRAGAVIIGKAHLHEFAYGVTNENAHFGPARNPHDPRRITGGSSGGSAASVAAAMALGSVGTDTRGSIRIPSAFCGVVGLKPTRGRVPLKGVLPLSWTLDHAGPIASRVEDVQLLYQVMSGRRWASAPEPTGLRLGRCDYYWQALDREVEKPLRSLLQTLQGAGLQIEPVQIPFLDEALEASRILAAADALAVHQDWLRTQPDGYDPAVLSRMLQGESITGVQVAEAFQLRRHLTASFREVFRRVDVLIGAAVPCLPPRIGAGHVIINRKKAPTVENLVRLNSPQNIAGVPSLVLRCGWSKQGLPIACQLIAASGREATLLSFAAWLERLVPV